MKTNKRKVDKKIVAQPQSKEIIREKPSHHIFSMSLILIISIAIYSNTLKNGFVYDDEFTIVNNTLIKNFGNLSKLFKKEYFKSSAEMSYRPVVTFTYFIDYWLYGIKPWGYHLTNILLHAINGVLLYVFLMLSIDARCKTQDARNKNQETEGILSLAFNFLPLISSLIFATHPVLTEAINAISFREDLLCFLFFISALILYIRGKRYLASYFLPFASCFFYLLALLSKEMAITFPLILFLYEWLFPLNKPVPEGINRGGGLRGLLFNPYTIGYIAVTCFYLFIRFYLFQNPAEDIPAWSLSERVMTVPYLILKYLFLLLAPVSLSADYVITPVQPLISVKFIIPFIIIILVSKKLKQCIILEG